MATAAVETPCQNAIATGGIAPAEYRSVVGKEPAEISDIAPTAAVDKPENRKQKGGDRNRDDHDRSWIPVAVDRLERHAFPNQRGRELRIDCGRDRIHQEFGEEGEDKDTRNQHELRKQQQRGRFLDLRLARFRSPKKRPLTSRIM